MCPAARCVLTPAGHAGPALHGDSALCRWADRVVCPYRWDVEGAVADIIRRTQVDALSPLEALNLLYELKSKLQ